MSPAMPSEHVRATGTVTARHAAAHCTVTLDNGTAVRARLSGKLQQKHMPRVIQGDRVEVRFSPTDLSHGQVWWRHKQ